MRDLPGQVLAYDKPKRLDRTVIIFHSGGRVVWIEERTVDFHSGDEVIADIEHLRRAGYTKTKNWNLTQVCEHLSATMKGGMDGFGFRLPWILRNTVVKWMFARMLRKRKMPNGAPTFARLKPTPEIEDDDAIIDDCIATIKRAETFDGSLEDYAPLDHLTADDWREFSWLHASHHLRFLVPNDSLDPPTNQA